MSGWTTLKAVTSLRTTAKSLQVRLPNGQEPYVPFTQMKVRPTGAMGAKIDVTVKTWLVEKWKVDAGHGPSDTPTFEFDPNMDIRVVATGGPRAPDADFMFDYSKKQLLAACMAYRSVLRQLADQCNTYNPKLLTTMERKAITLDGDMGQPDSDGAFPAICQEWANEDVLREIGKQADGVLTATTIGESMLEKMSGVERLLAEKRADVAAELLRSLDEDED